MPRGRNRLSQRPFTTPAYQRRLNCGIVLSITEDANCAYLPPHAHEQAFLVIPVNGGFWEHGELPRNYLVPGSCLFRPPASSHQNLIGANGSRILNLSLPSALSERISGQHSNEPHLAMLNGIATQAVTGLLKLLITGSKDRDGQVTDRVGVLLEQLTRKGQCVDPSLDAADRQIGDGTKVSLRVQDIAEHLNTNPVRLSRAYRRVYGISLKSRMMERRLSTAMLKLQSSHSCLAQAALDSGFYDQAHFSRAFRKYLGMSPGQYRRVSRPNSDVRN